MTTRAEAKEQTRRALIAAAMELFREHGIDGSSLDAICERAGKTRGAFYVHFADREALQVAVMEQIAQAYVSLVVRTADPAGDLQSSLDTFIGALTEATRNRGSSTVGVLGSDQLRVLLEGIHRNPEVRVRFRGLVDLVEIQLTEVIRAAQAGGRVRADVDPAGLAGLLIGQVLGLMATIEARDPSPEAIDRVVATLRQLLEPSVVGRTGLDP